MEGLLLLAVLLMGLRLPSFMNRLGMSKRDKIAFVGIAFLALGLAWLVVHAFGLIAVFA